MPSLRDRVKDTTTSTGTGNITLSGTAPSTYQTFANAYATGTPFLYCIAHQSANEWETGTGYLSASTTLVRDSGVMDGSSGPGVLVNFSAGTKDVFVTATAHFMEDSDSGALLCKAKGQALP